MNADRIYPEELNPDPDVYEKIRGTNLAVPAKNLKFKRWKGKFGDNFGGKPVMDFYGKPMFLELAIQRLASSGKVWTAYWQEVYPPRLLGPYYYTNWKEDLPKEERKNQPSYSLSDLNSSFHQDLICKIKKYNNDSYRGFWDGIAWKGQHTLFVESKWKDEIGDNQIDWLLAALSPELGLSLDKNFLIIRWHEEDS